jgi:hypothetical protein
MTMTEHLKDIFDILISKKTGKHCKLIFNVVKVKHVS